MLKRIVKFTNLKGEKKSEELYFYLSPKNLKKMDAKYQNVGGIKGLFEKMITKNDNRLILETIEDIILTSYGIVSEDGNRFIQNQTVREEFETSCAYEQLFDELTSTAEAFGEFLKKILPNDVQAEIAKAEKEGNVEMPEIVAEILKDQEENNAAENKVTSIAPVEG